MKMNWGAGGVDENVCIFPVCVCCRQKVRGGGKRENETEKVMRFVISSVHPGPLFGAGPHCRQSSPWRHLKTEMDGEL